MLLTRGGGGRVGGSIFCCRMCWDGREGLVPEKKYEVLKGAVLIEDLVAV